jgi:DNA repair exonuclease SbcCD ATPase subunit
VARYENENVRFEADRDTFAMAYNKVQMEKARTLAELEEMKAKLNMSKEDFNKVRQDYEKAKKEQVALENSVREERVAIANQMKKVRNDTQQTMIMIEDSNNSKDRVEVDVQKLKTELALVKNRNEEARRKLSESNQAVMESRLALEEARTDLTEEMATGAKGRWKHDTMGFKMRGLASVVDSSQMVGGESKAWVVKKTCAIFKTASGKKNIGSVNKDDRLIASPAGNFVKIMNSSGDAAYVDSACGEFAE